MKHQTKNILQIQHFDGALKPRDNLNIQNIEFSKHSEREGNT